MPAVTVLMSCYNASRYLPEAVESILTQSYRDYEFIIVNDGSTDNTSDVLRRYAAQDDRIVLIEKENSGLADSLNVGIEAARGMWIARLDADDIALPCRLERQVAFMVNHLDCHLLGSALSIIDGKGMTVKRHRYPAHHDRLLSDLRRFRPFFAHSTAMFVTEAVRRRGGYNTYYRRSQDKDLWLRVAEWGQIACLQEPLVNIRRHGEQISHHGNGRPQVIYGVAAGVCHFIRMRGEVDPSSGTMATWEHFLEWLALRVEEHGLFRCHEERCCLRERRAAAHGKLAGAWCLLRGVVSSQYAFALMCRKYFGSNIAQRLADEWICRALPAQIMYPAPQRR